MATALPFPMHKHPPRRFSGVPLPGESDEQEVEEQPEEEAGEDTGEGAGEVTDAEGPPEPSTTGDAPASSPTGGESTGA